MTTEEIFKIFDLKPRDGQMIIIGVFVFTAFWAIVHRLIFTPFLALYEEREALTSGARESSQQLLDSAKAIEARCEEEIHKTRVAVIAEKLQALNAAKSQAVKIAEEVENEVQDLVKRARSEREQGLAETKRRILAESDSLAQEVVRKLTSGASAN